MEINELKGQAKPY